MNNTVKPKCSTYCVFWSNSSSVNIKPFSILCICTNWYTMLYLAKNASFAANLYVLSDPLFLSFKNKLLHVFGLFFVTIVISIIVIFCVAFFSGYFFSAANVTILSGTKSLFVICANSSSSTSLSPSIPRFSKLNKSNLSKTSSF